MKTTGFTKSLAYLLLFVGNGLWSVYLTADVRYRLNRHEPDCICAAKRLVAMDANLPPALEQAILSDQRVLVAASRSGGSR